MKSASFLLGLSFLVFGQALANDCSLHLDIHGLKSKTRERIEAKLTDLNYKLSRNKDLSNFTLSIQEHQKDYLLWGRNTETGEILLSKLSRRPFRDIKKLPECVEQPKSFLPREFFTENGKITSFRWTPASYQTGFQYDILYYIPQSLGENVPQQAIIFMHGGGGSTVTRNGSYSVANMYLQDLVDLAEKLKTPIIAPSGSGLNWGGHTRVMMRDLAKVIRQDFKVNPNSLALVGHSMGAMGITREAFWLADQFSFVMPLAGGMDEIYMTPANLGKFFNLPYYQINGKNDHFEVFYTRTVELDKRMKKLAASERENSQLTVEFFDGEHNYDLDLVEKRLKTLFQKKRNLFQATLYPSFYYRPKTQIHTDPYGNKFNFVPVKDYFWVEAKEFHPTTKDVVITDIKVKALGNNISIKSLSTDSNVKTLRLHLSINTIDFAKEVNIWLNDRKIKTYQPSLKPSYAQELIQTRGDTGLDFQDYVDVTL